MSYAPPGTFPGAAQQQLAQLAQQQQQQMQAQQAFQVQQSGLASLPKPQQDLLNSLTPQQIQSLLGQANSNLTQQSMNISSQFNPASQIPQLNQAPAISTVQPMPAQNMNAILSDMVNKAKAGLLTPLQLSQVCISCLTTASFHFGSTAAIVSANDTVTTANDYESKDINQWHPPEYLQCNDTYYSRVTDEPANGYAWSKFPGTRDSQFHGNKFGVWQSESA